jgi:hypothetical protein
MVCRDLISAARSWTPVLIGKLWARLDVVGGWVADY